jgi:hypothetical protein
VTRFLLLLALASISSAAGWAQAVIGPQQPPITINSLYFNKMHWAGPWVGTAAYNSQDVVTVAGLGYVSLQPLNVGQPPATSPIWWVALPAGAPGPPGPPGTGSEVPPLPFSQTISTPLVGGSPATVTLTPCPTGLSGGDTSHYLYISGTGSSEAVLVTGGTCATGAPAGTISFTPAQSHAGGYAVSSATLGIQEAINSIQPKGGAVQLTGGVYPICAQAIIPSNTALRGVGRGASVIQITTGCYGGLPWLIPGTPGTRPYTAVVAFAQGSTNAAISDLTIDINSQSFNPSGTNGPGSNPNYNPGMQGAIVGSGVVSPRIQRVAIIGWPPTDGVPISLFGGSSDGLISDVYGAGVKNCVISPAVGGPGFIFVQGGPHRIENNYAQDSCDESYVSNFAHDVVMVHNTYNADTAVMPIGGGIGAFHCENSTHCSIVENTCIGDWAGGSATTAAPGVCFLAAPAGGSTGADSADVLIRGNHATAANLAVGIGNNGDSTTTSRRTTISDNDLTGNAQFGILLQGQIVDINIHDNVIYGNKLSGINSYSNNNGKGPFLGVNIHDNNIKHNGTTATNGVGISLNSASGCTADQLQINNNIIGDSDAVPVQGYGIQRVSPALCSYGSMLNNTLVGNINGGIVGGSGQNGEAFTSTDWTSGMKGPNFDGINNLISGDSTALDYSVFNNASKWYQAHKTVATGTLNSATPPTVVVTLTGSAVFTAPNTYACTVNDDVGSGTAYYLTIAKSSGTQFTVIGSTGTATHPFSVVCIGY